jgi:hypothetical protein
LPSTDQVKLLAFGRGKSRTKVTGISGAAVSAGSVNALGMAVFCATDVAWSGVETANPAWDPGFTDGVRLGVTVTGWGSVVRLVVGTRVEGLVWQVARQNKSSPRQINDFFKAHPQPAGLDDGPMG